jgi:hypothetical protein
VRRPRKFSQQDAQNELDRLCDLYKYSRTDAGALAAVVEALQDGEKISAKPRRSRGQPKYNYAKPLMDFAAGRRVLPQPPPRPLKWDARKLEMLLLDIERIEMEAGRQLSDKTLVRQLPKECGVRTEHTLRRLRRKARLFREYWLGTSRRTSASPQSSVEKEVAMAAKKSKKKKKKKMSK